MPPDSAHLANVLGLDCHLVEQTKPLGTGHALAQVRGLLSDHRGNILVINSDAPLISPDTLRALKLRHESTQSCLTLLTCIEPPAEDMGRVVLGEDGGVVIYSGKGRSEGRRCDGL